MPRLLDRLYLACIWVAGAAIVAMALIVPAGVFMRYVLGQGARWPEPVAILLMVVFTFIGAAAAYRGGGHIAVGLLTDALPAPLRRACEKLVDALMLLVCGFVAWYGSRLSWDTMGQSIAEIPWMPVGVTYLAIPLGALITLVFVLERMVWGPQAARDVVRVGDAP